MRPPGGGYEVFAGDEQDLVQAKKKAEQALQNLLEEIRKRMSH